MPIATDTFLDPILVKFACSKGRKVPPEARGAFSFDGESKNPKIQEFLGNPRAIRKALIRNFFRNGWMRLNNEGKFATVWDQEYVENKALDAEARYVETWPDLSREEKQRWVFSILEKKVPHARPSWHFGKRQTPGHPRHTPRRGVSSMETA